MAQSVFAEGQLAKRSRPVSSTPSRSFSALDEHFGVPETI
jgi:hypothetical protein